MRSRTKREAHGAREAATESGFPRIGLINGSQLSDLLIEYWNDIPDDFQEMLGLKFELVAIQVKPAHQKSKAIPNRSAHESRVFPQIP
jgi:hypothetical protein